MLFWFISRHAEWKVNIRWNVTHKFMTSCLSNKIWFQQIDQVQWIYSHQNFKCAWKNTERTKSPLCKNMFMQRDTKFKCAVTDDFPCTNLLTALNGEMVAPTLSSALTCSILFSEKRSNLSHSLWAISGVCIYFSLFLNEVKKILFCKFSYQVQFVE